MSENIQELLDLLEEIEKPKVISGPLDEFINNFNIVSGDEKVPTHVLYFTYCKSTTNPISKIHFFRLFSKLFTQKRSRSQRFYLLNKDSFDYSREGILLAEKHRDDQKENQKK